jgi:hypothetical protein
MPSLNSGGAMRKSRNIYIGRHGGYYVYQRRVEVWVSETYNVLTYLC